MTQREARRLALLIIASDAEIGLDNSDEWFLHPETNAGLHGDDVVRVRNQGRRIIKKLFSQAAGLQRPAQALPRDRGDPS